ncbi:MAG: hypothetical protein VYE18_00650 [Pseudomonadota bacterium]|nr:hypothetical protein [Pseudomonadota bacterium]
MEYIYQGDGNGDGVIELTGDCNYNNFASTVSAEGLTPNDFVSLQMSFTDRSYWAPACTVRAKVLGDAKPLSALMVAASLTSPEFQVEVEAMAAKV